MPENKGRSGNTTSFKPGKSGNPGGRPKKREDLVARCISAVDDHVVEAWLKEVVGRGADWVECSRLLAAYGYGRPVQAVRHEGTIGVTITDLVREAAGSHEE